MNGAVLLLNMGGPDSEEAVEPFLENLFSEPAILPLPLPFFLRPALARFIARKRAVKVRPRYRDLGGSSPQNEITALQAKALEARLAGDGEWRVYFAMRYWHPRADKVLEEIGRLDPGQLVVVSLYPHYSSAVGGSSIGEVQRLLKKQQPKLNARYVRDFHCHPLFIEAHSRRILKSLESFPGSGKDAVVLFSAHNLPERLIRKGDPYLDQVKATVKALLPAIGSRQWRLSFQSRSGPVKWLDPETLDAMKTLAGEGHKHVLLVPLSFVCDMIETLYEIDGFYKEEAARLGIETFARTPAFNDSEDFIDLLRDLTLEAD
jgi:ferrochelatase